MNFFLNFTPRRLANRYAIISLCAVTISMQTETDSGKSEFNFSRYLPLMVWVGAILLLLLIPLKILSTGFLPPDDVLRHTAKVISGKTWPEIILVREGFGGDEHPGWHAILGALHRWFSWDA